MIFRALCAFREAVASGQLRHFSLGFGKTVDRASLLTNSMMSFVEGEIRTSEW